MNRGTFRNRVTQSTLAAITLALAGGSVNAQPVKEITVEAPRQVQMSQSTQVDRSDPAAQIQITTVKMLVGYGDLDLAKSADADAFRARVKVAAKSVCKQLDKLYPLVTDSGCVDNAVASAKAQVEAAITAAETR